MVISRYGFLVSCTLGLAAVSAMMVMPVSRAVAATGEEPLTAEDPVFKAGFEPVVTGPCGTFYEAGFSAVMGQVAVASPSSGKPAKGQITTDPNFHTCVVRATNHAAEPPQGFARNDYSRRQAFNADNTRFIVYSENGFWHLYDARTLTHLRALTGPAGDAEPQWHPTSANTLYYVPTNGGTRLMSLNVETNQSTVAADFAGRLPWNDVAHIWTKSEGSPSADGRYWCFQAENASFGIRGVFTYDLQTNTILGTKALTARPDHVSMSASGRWCVVSHLSDAGGTKAWNRTFTSSRQLHTTSEHSDLALGTGGEDYFVFVDYQSNTGDLVMVNIDTGARTALLPTYINGTATAYHVSGKNFAKPGWFLLSTYARVGAEKWLHERIMAVELSAMPRILNIAHHHSVANGYWTEPHASVSRDFTRVLFTSNWGVNSSTDVDAYIVQLPPAALPQ
ncbi:hypothetical protein [Tahibacter amnicola]|uniref:WD40 repeat protein n=1 Tax=Tahibacter amnicola TaxID=2976241 RepID=A0ABY6B9W9_9GAMM|nr:hypothetical protein [Tahibacter amnicola]UXI66331.1 hypothetical protein N4264_16420 [Tahibacter amnicola]